MAEREDLIRVVAYTPLDDKVFIYNFVTEHELQETAATFMNDIWFYLTDEEINEYLTPEEQVNNLKEDFIWFQPGVNKLHIMQCTCGEFLESGRNMDKLARLAVRHSRKTGHSLNPRGN